MEGDWSLQTPVMQVMMMIFVVSIPLMLLVKPIVLGCCVSHHDDKDEHYKRAVENEVEMQHLDGSNASHEQQRLLNEEIQNK